MNKSKSIDFLEEELLYARLKDLISDVIFGSDSIIVFLHPSKDSENKLMSLKKFIKNNFDDIKYISINIDKNIDLYSLEIFHYTHLNDVMQNMWLD